MNQYKTTIYFWRKHKDQLHLMSTEVVSSDPDDFNSKMIVTLNRIHGDPEKLAFSDGILSILPEPTTTSRPTTSTRPRGQTADDGSAPICPVHGEQMSVSKYKGKGASISYYCQQEDRPGQYCNQICDIVKGEEKHKALKRR